MYFLVNASPPKPLDVAASKFAADVEGTGYHFKVRSRSKVR